MGDALPLCVGGFEVMTIAQSQLGLDRSEYPFILLVYDSPNFQVHLTYNYSPPELFSMVQLFALIAAE